MSALDQITDDLNWREGELGSLKLLLKRPGNSTKQQAILLRAAWAMLYAHYEGYSKFCLTVFYDEVQKRMLQCRALPDKTRVFALGKKLKKLRSANSANMLQEIESFQYDCLDISPEFPEVDTKSNLWPQLLAELLEYADINSEQISKNRVKINTLVSRRNGIAHGEKNMISEVDYYLTYENAVYEIMYDLAYQIDERLKAPPYT